MYRALLKAEIENFVTFLKGASALVLDGHDFESMHQPTKTARIRRSSGWENVSE